MRNKIFGLIGMLWGGSSVLYGIFGPAKLGSEAYQAGQNAGFAFGVLMFIVGAYYFFKTKKID